MHNQSPATVRRSPRLLLAGSFTFHDGTATLVELEAAITINEWLEAAGHDVVLASAAAGRRRIHPDASEPGTYDAIVFVGAPSDDHRRALKDRWPDTPIIAAAQALAGPRSTDASGGERQLRDEDPHIAFAAAPSSVAVVGLAGPLDDPAQGIAPDVAAVLGRLPCAVVKVNTLATDPASAVQMGSLIRRMDAMVAVGVDGLVLSIRAGVPVVAVDAGDGIAHEAAIVGWPLVIGHDDLTCEALSEALDYCGSRHARSLAASCRARALRAVQAVRHDLIAQMDTVLAV